MTVAVGKQEQTYALLRERVIDGTYGPGHRLVIDALARELEVSPMPIREAIRRLEAEGWLTYQRNQGAQVAPIDAEQWTDAMASMAVLEGYATAIAAPHVTADDLVRLRALNAEMQDAVGVLDVLRISECNQAFHEAIYARCPNRHLQHELAITQERLTTLRSTIFTFIPTRGAVSLQEHEQLLVMIEQRRDPPEVELFAREHKMHTLAAYRRRLAEEKS